MLVLETGLAHGTPARIHTIDLATRAVLGVLDFPNTATGLWRIDANDFVGPIGFQAPQLIILDRATSTESSVPIGVHPDVLRAVPVP